jgi:hypothetical protein
VPASGVRTALRAPGPKAAAAGVAGSATEIDRSTLAQGGDPYLPPALRVRPAASSPRGAALESLVRAKIAARDRDVYR